MKCARYSRLPKSRKPTLPQLQKPGGAALRSLGRCFDRKAEPASDTNPRHRRRLADRIRPTDRRPHAHRARRGPRRGTRAGRPGRRARTVAETRASRTIPARGSWPPRSIARSICWRREKLLERKHEELGRELEAQQESAVPDFDAAIDDDSRRRPAAPCCSSPAIPFFPPRRAPRSRCACSAASPPTRSPAPSSPRSRRSRSASFAPSARWPKRASRSKFPAAPNYARASPRCSRCIYLIFNEGYSATAGDDWMRPALCEEALRLGRILAELAPNEPEVHGLVALMEIQASRFARASGPAGEPILLARSEPRALGSAPIRRGLAALERAEQLRGPTRPLHTAGRDRRLPRPRPHRRGHGLGAHRGALRSARGARAITGRRAESRGRRLDGRRSGGRPRHRRRPGHRAVTKELPPAAERARRPARQARPPRRSPRRIRTAATLTRNTRERELLLDRARSCSNAVQSRAPHGTRNAPGEMA